MLKLNFYFKVRFWWGVFVFIDSGVGFGDCNYCFFVELFGRNILRFLCLELVVRGFGYYGNKYVFFSICVYIFWFVFWK